MAWRIAASAVSCASLLLMLGTSGCSSAATAAQSVATAAAANVAAAATQPSTYTAAATTVSNAQSSTSSQGIFGRWIHTGQVITPDGNLTTGLLAEIVINKNGTFVNQSRAGVAAIAHREGTFNIAGNVLTTHLGSAKQSYVYKINGSELLLTNPTTHQTVVFQRG